MIFDRILIRFRRDLLHKLQSYIVSIIISGSILASNLHYFSFFGGEDVDMAIDRTSIRNHWGLA